MGGGLHKAFWNLLRRLRDPGADFEAKRILVQRPGQCLQSNSNAQGRQSRRGMTHMNAKSPAVVLAMVLAACGSGIPRDATAQSVGAWMNASLSPDMRADLVIEQLTVDEK